jgi:ligand-binding SRPBCC domain-containing protein
MQRFELTSVVSAPEAEVWARVTTPEGFNGELMPLMRMTVPRRMRGRTIGDVSAPERLGRSWLLLFGFLPFDYDDIGIAELGPGSRFLERSTMLSMRAWEHERTVTALGPDSCEVRDRLGYELRAPLRAVGLGRVLVPALRRVFAHRHRRLQRHFWVR